MKFEQVKTATYPDKCIWITSHDVREKYDSGHLETLIMVHELATRLNRAIEELRHDPDEDGYLRRLNLADELEAIPGDEK